MIKQLLSKNTESKHVLSASSIGDKCGDQVRRLYSVFGDSGRTSLLNSDKDEDQRTPTESPAKQDEGTRTQGIEGKVEYDPVWMCEIQLRSIDIDSAYIILEHRFSLESDIFWDFK